jgi:rSAM/selenodomain-associated transferase 1
MKCGIIIMAKVPEAGKVKTRLQPTLTPQQSAELANCLLQDTVSKAETLQYRLIIAYSPIDERSFFDSFTNHNFTLVAQVGVDLGEKMFNAFRFAFEQNLDSIVMIGTDSPTFPSEFIEKAFEILREKDSVLGKTEDGGFYLIGMSKLDKKIFENVEWSSLKTFEQTKNNLENLGFRLGELPVWYDVDEPKDLARLREDQCLHEFAPLTAEWFKALN